MLQVGFQEHIVIDNSVIPDHPKQLLAADINGDGIMDLVSSSNGDNKITLYEGRIGQPAFKIPQTIINSCSSSPFIQLEDIDGDGDIDILVANVNQEINWHANIDGMGNFSEKHTIYAGGSVIPQIRTADIRWR